MRDPKRAPVPYLEAWRLHNLLSQAGLAKKAGVGKNTVKRLEDGEQANLLTIHKIARGLEITVDRLLNEKPNVRAA